MTWIASREIPVVSDPPRRFRPRHYPGHLFAAMRRFRDEAGNTLILFPVGVLILFGLGAVAIDSATVFLAQRRLADLSAAIANDAVSGVDIASFYGTDGTVTLDGDRGSARSSQLRSGQTQDRAFESVACTVDTAGNRATVVCSGQVRPILATFLPGSDRRQLTATETAIGQQG
jgi:Flp pilus assembly protein TadG